MRTIQNMQIPYSQTNKPKTCKNNLDKLSTWAQNWQMNFNEDKCKVLHIGYRNEKANYIMNGTQLKSVDKETDLGVTISSNLKPSQQCAEVVKKANKM